METAEIAIANRIVPSNGDTFPKPEDLIARARAMVPVLREREAEAIAARQVPEETIRAFIDAGFFKVLQPRRHGGYEMSPAVYCEIARTLAEGCMSSAWVYGVVAVHNWQLALFDPQAAEDVWAEDDSVLVSSSYMPMGKVTKVEGGYRLNGRWAFSSGSAHCDWVILGANMPAEEGGAPEPFNFLVPRADYEIVDTWHTMGLCATGSNDIVIEDAFVPAHRVIRELDMFRLDCPGMAANPGALYRIPFAQLFNRTVSTTSLGSLRHALQTFIKATKEKRATYTGARLAADTTIQEAVAEVKVILNDLELRLSSDLAELDRRAEANDWPIERRAELGHHTTSMVNSCVRAIDLLMLFSGGKAIYLGNPIQRAFLDIHCARAHVANNPFPYARNVGAMAFGFDNDCLDL
ncbi:acyl-CoA dehydrogenase family protein [Novosphingobium cyanobacteriorum]|uniref:Acyl-CoA dehydrogenase family protein n=1 Tax=Novosphingobium cyanobacteriorum TaxID=3024215 RepID=A0ABT6CIH0_9SPHN|nr:acyl-CoA dehydrogenase family protein [Novosphingobium cyanobacteriorum]MDF8333718.1 acyl-CoA dehydrogenase family protein [Novosphingobium cyanobacteriorum]